MAEIPVERKTGGGGLPWWLIPLLLLLVLIPLLFFLSRGCNDNAGVVGNANNGNANRIVATTTTNVNTTTVANSTTVANTGATNANTNVASGPAVTDVNFFAGVNDKTTLVGRNVNLTGVRVNQVLSDKVFTVKSGDGEMYVLLDEGLDTGGGKEQQIKMRSGQTVNINGSFRSVPTGEVSQERQGGGLNAAEYARMKGQQAYLHATSVSDAK